MKSVKLLAFAGSTRTESFNKKLLAAAIPYAEAAGAAVTVVDLRDFPMPLYDGDLEESDGVPKSAVALKELVTSHHGLLLACPEYNGSFSAVLKNTLDWLSRQKGTFNGQTAALLSASPGALGGLRGLVHVRSVLTNLGVLVSPQQAAVGGAFKQFDDSGALSDEKTASRVQGVVENLVTLVQRLQQES